MREKLCAEAVSGIKSTSLAKKLHLHLHLSPHDELFILPPLSHGKNGVVSLGLGCINRQTGGRYIGVRCRATDTITF